MDNVQFVKFTLDFLGINLRLIMFTFWWKMKDYNCNELEMHWVPTDTNGKFKLEL